MAHLTDRAVPDAARCRAPALPRRRRLPRYGGVSLVTAGLAQGGLALGYGALRWSTTSAVVLSLLVSVGPAYWLNHRYVWPERSTKGRQIVPFAVLAAAGSGVAAVTTYGAEHLARAVTSDHAALSVVVNATALITTLAVWALRFLAFDRYVFTERRGRAVLRTSP